MASPPQQRQMPEIIGHRPELNRQSHARRLPFFKRGSKEIANAAGRIEPPRKQDSNSARLEGSFGKRGRAKSTNLQAFCVREWTQK